jgi:hypothetical protein
MKLPSIAIGLGLLCACASARNEVKLGLSGGLASAGIISGGFTPTASAAYGFSLSDRATATIGNYLDVTGLTYGNPGFIDRNVLGVGGRWPDFHVDGGVSADVFYTILCAMRDGKPFCNRVTGVSPGARASVTYFNAELFHGRLGVRATGYGTWVVTGSVYSGPLVGADVGLVARIK